MGLFDIVKNELNAQQEKSAHQSECGKDQSVQLNIIHGANIVGTSSAAYLRQKLDGRTYFDFNDTVFYDIIGYEWNGPIFENVIDSHSQGSSNSTTVKKGKAGKMATGAIVGSILFPGVGTIVGAAVGAGGKSKKNTSGTQNSSSQQVHKQVEKDSTAILKLQRASDGALCSITIKCNSTLDAKIRCFIIQEQPTAKEVSKDTTEALKGIKALKELLDMGAITQEEFDSKKKQILNL